MLARLSFLTDEDRVSFLKILQDQCKTINWVCHAYCLMDNHYYFIDRDARWESIKENATE